MRCPFCGHDETAVKDSRVSPDSTSIRRRRHCLACEGRFTTVEHVQLLPLRVVKKNGTVEPFVRDKLAQSVLRALHKRPIEPERVELVISSLVRQFESRGEMEIASHLIGEQVMEILRDLDAVAYIRFACIYLEFSAPGDFAQFIQGVSAREISE